ncbi:imidazoleglycerol-phosphate dehydratase 1 [Scenedesmus sp. PABB004]|nr:imidazoleglycerol-phosphate dehydratase 1 [Scenedesmus sp. PABB004]
MRGSTACRAPRPAAPVAVAPVRRRASLTVARVASVQAGGTPAAQQQQQQPAAAADADDAYARARHLAEAAVREGRSHPGLELPEVRGRRVAVVARATKETRVEVRLDLDGTGRCVANTPVGFFNHMLDQLASHGLFDVYVSAEGDTWIDDHHTVEDVALALGAAFAQALGDRAGIARFGEFTAPLDEALTHVVLDLSGRAHLSCDLAIPAARVGGFDTELVEHFFSSWAGTSGTTLHIRQLAGRNSHHIIEATFKAFARALRRACEADPRRGGRVASSKGVLTQQ